MAELGARKSDTFKAICTDPSINKTPVGSALVPVAYPVLHDLGNSITTSKTTRFNNDPAYLFDMTTQPKTTGDEPGTGKGIRSGTVDGEIKPTKGSGSFRIEGKPVVRHYDPCTLNGGNCSGIFVFVGPPGCSIANGQPTRPTDPPKKPTPAQEKAWYERTWDWAKQKTHETGEWLDEKGNEIGSALGHPIDAAKGAYKDLANTATDAANLVSRSGYQAAAADQLNAGALNAAFGNTQVADDLTQRGMQMMQNPQLAPTFSEPYPNLTAAEKGGALISNFSPKGLGKALIVGGTKTLGKDIGKTLLKDEAKALEHTAAQDAETATVQAEAKQAEKTAESKTAKEAKESEPKAGESDKPPPDKGAKVTAGPCDHLRQGSGKGKYRGGAHSKTSKPVNDGKDSHHMPAKQVSPLSHDDGPAIQMDPPDHGKTSSNGNNGAAGKAYRNKIGSLIAQGKWREAMTLEIKDVRRVQKLAKDPRKYNEAMLEMLEYFKCLEKNSLLK